MQPLAFWDCGFECRQGHGSLSLVSVVCCQVEVSATGRSLSRGVLPSVVSRKECDCGTSTMRGLDPLGLSNHRENKVLKLVKQKYTANFIHPILTPNNITQRPSPIIQHITARDTFL
jgi:hypothetical protein